MWHIYVYWYRVAKTHKVPYLCRSFSAKDPLILGLFRGIWPTKMRHIMGLRHPVSVYIYMSHTYITPYTLHDTMHDIFACAQASALCTKISIVCTTWNILTLYVWVCTSVCIYLSYVFVCAQASVMCTKISIAFTTWKTLILYICKILALLYLNQISTN